jgi:hypothetical protein
VFFLSLVNPEKLKRYGGKKTQFVFNAVNVGYFFLFNVIYFDLQLIAVTEMSFSNVVKWPSKMATARILESVSPGITGGFRIRILASYIASIVVFHFMISELIAAFSILQKIRKKFQNGGREALIKKL